MNTILIVDDHSDIRRLLSITLGKEFKILEAEDGVSSPGQGTTVSLIFPAGVSAEGA